VFIFDVHDLTVAYAAPRARRVVDGVSFGIGAGEIIGVSGPSGCGKSTMALALIGLLPSDAEVSGRIQLRGRDLRSCSERELARIRGTQIGIVFQESALALNPLMSVGAQIAEVIRAHERCDGDTARQRALAAMDDVGLIEGRARIYDAYPHELSGGQRQRALFAQAIAGGPAIVIADEPTASLDAGAREGVLALIRSLSARRGTSFLLISHSPDVLATTAQRVIEMREGRIVSDGDPSRDVVSPPPAPRAASSNRGGEPIVDVRDATKVHCHRRLLSTRHHVDALVGVNLRLERGATLGLTGPSGCGKSTLARCIAGLDRLDGGEVRIDGRPLARLRGSARQHARNQVQLIFQDAASALNPRFTGFDVIAEPMIVQKVGNAGDRRLRAIKLVRQVGLPVDTLTVRPGELSGGERQRLAIARALAVHPRALILDEAFSGLDLETRGRIIELLRDLQAVGGLSYLCISHDLHLLSEFASEIVEMRAGRIVDAVAGPALDAVRVSA